MLAEDTPIYQQLAAQLANDIVSGTYPEGSGVPSAQEYSVFYQMNPATAGKALNVLVEQGVLYKKRGIGMFVAEGATGLLRTRRQAEFRERYIEPLKQEARMLGIEIAELKQLIEEDPHD